MLWLQISGQGVSQTAKKNGSLKILQTTNFNPKKD